MCRLIVALSLILLNSNISSSQVKKPTVTFGIDKGIEKSNSRIFSLSSTGLENISAAYPHSYWRFYVGIPFIFPRFKIDAGLGFSSNQFRQKIFIFNDFEQRVINLDYSGIGFDYFIKIPLGIGDDRFDMGPEFRHQLMMANYNDGQNPLGNNTNFSLSGRVNNTYFNVGAFANYMLIRKNEIDIGMSASVGYSTFKYDTGNFISSHLSIYMHFGLVFYMYKTSQKIKTEG